MTRVRKQLVALAISAMFPLCEVIAQGEIIVDSTGAGDYTELQPAIDAAEPWQIIRVRHGVYTGATIRKSVRLLGDPFQFIGAGDVATIEITSPIFIRDLPAGVPVVISDLAADPTKIRDLDDLIDAKNCAGPIHLAFTQQGNIVLEDCVYVTITNHFGFGKFRIRSSTVVASRCSLHEWEGPIIDLYNSTFFASRLITSPDKPGDQAVRVDGGTRFIADFDSSINGGGFGVPAFDIIDGTVDERRTDHLIFNGSRGGPSLDQSPNFLLFELKRQQTTPQAEIVAAGLPIYPLATSNGELFLDPSNAEILHFGSGFVEEDIRVHLPAILKPSRYFDMNPPATRLALPDARLQGIPVVFQGAFLIDGVAKYTLPYIIVL